MQYCPVDEKTKVHLLKLIDWLFDEIVSAGGDGDAYWYSRYYSVKDLFVLVEEYIKKDKSFSWNLELKDDKISCWRDQECLVITNKESDYLSFPTWGQVKIVH